MSKKALIHLSGFNAVALENTPGCRSIRLRMRVRTYVSVSVMNDDPLLTSR